jgi:hypothetical protein
VARARAPFPQIRDHVLLPYADAIAEADAVLSSRLTFPVVTSIVDLIPDSWLPAPGFSSPKERRSAYVSYLMERLQPPRVFAQEAMDARAGLV